LRVGKINVKMVLDTIVLLMIDLENVRGLVEEEDFRGALKKLKKIRRDLDKCIEELYKFFDYSI